MEQAIIRLIVLVIMLVNQTLVVLGKNPLPFSEEEIYEGVSSLATAIVALWTWWKNNSVTKKAMEADEYLKKLRTGKK